MLILLQKKKKKKKSSLKLIRNERMYVCIYVYMYELIV